MWFGERLGGECDFNLSFILFNVLADVQSQFNYIQWEPDGSKITKLLETNIFDLSH